MRRQFDLQLYGRPERAEQQRAHVFDQHGQVDRGLVQFLLAREGEHARSERGAALGTGPGVVHQTQQRRVGRHAPAQQFQAAEHRHQQIVEVVGDTAGEVAQRFHLVQLLQRLFGGDAFTDIQRLRHQRDDVAVLAEHGAHGKVEDAYAARHVQAHGDVLGVTCRNALGHGLDRFRHAGRGGEPGRRPEGRSRQLVKTRADAGQRRGVDVENRAVRRQHRLVQVGGFQHRANVGFTACQGCGALRYLGLQLFQETLLALPDRRRRAHALDMRPGAVGDFRQQGKFVAAPDAWLTVVYRHQCGQPTFLYQWQADGGGDVELLERGCLGGRQLRAMILDDEGLAAA